MARHLPLPPYTMYTATLHYTTASKVAAALATCSTCMAGTPKGRQTTAVHACIDPIGASMQQTVLELPGSQRKYPIPRAKPERLSSGPSAHYGAAGS